MFILFLETQVFSFKLSWIELIEKIGLIFLQPAEVEGALHLKGGRGLTAEEGGGLPDDQGEGRGLGIPKP